MHVRHPAPGQWVQVDMQQPQTFNKLVLDNTWALWDTPVSYEVAVDGRKWSESVASGPGTLGISTITFPAQTASYLRHHADRHESRAQLVDLRAGCLQQPLRHLTPLPPRAPGRDRR
jgi:hypothetical protein